MAGRVLILGGYGEVGRRLASILDGRGAATTISGRSPEAARRLARSLGLACWSAVDLADIEGLVAAASEASLVVNCSGVESAPAARAVLEAGIDLVDISATPAYLEELEALGRDATGRGARVLFSIGLAPGLTNLLAVRLLEEDPGAESIEITCLLGLGERAGDASRAWTLGNLGRSFSAPSAPDHQVRNFSEARAVELPAGFGSRRAFRFDFPEQHLLGPELGVPIVNRLCFDSRLATAAMALVARSELAATALRHLSGRLPQGALGSDWWVGCARIPSGRTLWATGRNQAWGTAAVTALGIERLGQAGPGASQLHQLATVDELAPELRALGIHGAFASAG